MIGLYKLFHQIGERGMGVVYMANQQEPVRRRVALKRIKPGRCNVKSWGVSCPPSPVAPG